jgi:hypothetical protein
MNGRGLLTPPSCREHLEQLADLDAVDDQAVDVAVAEHDAAQAAVVEQRAVELRA